MKQEITNESLLDRAIVKAVLWGSATMILGFLGFMTSGLLSYYQAADVAWWLALLVMVLVDLAAIIASLCVIMVASPSTRRYFL